MTDLKKYYEGVLKSNREYTDLLQRRISKAGRELYRIINTCGYENENPDHQPCVPHGIGGKITRDQLEYAIEILAGDHE